MDLAEILQIEKHAENTFVGVFSAVCENVYRSRQTDVNATPRVSCKSIVGESEGNQQIQIASPLGNIYSSWRCRGEFTISTNRTTDANDDNHNALVGQIRARCIRANVDAWQNEQTSSALPIFITQMKPSENIDDEEDSDNVDNTKLSYEFIASINPDAITYNP